MGESSELKTPTRADRIKDRIAELAPKTVARIQNNGTKQGSELSSNSPVDTTTEDEYTNIEELPKEGVINPSSNISAQDIPNITTKKIGKDKSEAIERIRKIAPKTAAKMEGADITNINNDDINLKDRLKELGFENDSVNKFFNAIENNKNVDLSFGDTMYNKLLNTKLESDFVKAQELNNLTKDYRLRKKEQIAQIAPKTVEKMQQTTHTEQPLDMGKSAAINQGGSTISLLIDKSKYTNNDNVYDNFITEHKQKGLIEKSPDEWNGKTVDDAIKHLNMVDGAVKIKSPIEEISIYKSHLEHLITENDIKGNTSRKKYLNRTIRTIQEPNIITKRGQYHNYIKLFDDGKIKPHLQIVKVKPDGSFYVTNFRPSKQQLKSQIIEGQVIYDLSSLSSIKNTDNNSITDVDSNFNPSQKYNKELSEDTERTIGKALYTINKEAKKIRDIRENLKEFLFYQVDLEKSTLEYLKEKYPDVNFDSEKGAVYIDETDTTYTAEQLGEYINELRNKVFRLYDEIEQTKENNEDATELEDDYEFNKSELDYVEEELQKLNEVNLHEILKDSQKEIDKLYNLKQKILNKFNNRKQGQHKFNDGSARNLYEIGGFTFHGEDISDSLSQEEYDKLEQLDNISSENKLSDDEKITTVDAINLLNDYLNNGKSVYQGTFDESNPNIYYDIDIPEFMKKKNEVDTGYKDIDLTPVYSEVQKGIKGKDLAKHLPKEISDFITEVAEDYTIREMQNAEGKGHKGLHSGKRKIIELNLKAIGNNPYSFMSTLAHELEHARQKQVYQRIISKPYKTWTMEERTYIAHRNICSRVNRARGVFYKAHKELIDRFEKNEFYNEEERKQAISQLSAKEKFIIDVNDKNFNNYYNAQFEINARITGEKYARGYRKESGHRGLGTSGTLQTDNGMPQKRNVVPNTRHSTTGERSEIRSNERGLEKLDRQNQELAEEYSIGLSQFREKPETVEKVVKDKATKNIAEVLDYNKVDEILPKVKNPNHTIGKNIFTPISSRLDDIHPSLRHAILKFEYNLGLNENKYAKTVKPFIDKLDKMSKIDYARYDLALKNGKTDVINALNTKYGIEEEYSDIKTLLDNIRREAIESGLEVGQVENYFPRKVIDSGKLIEHYSKNTYLKKMLHDVDPNNVLSPEDKIEKLNIALKESNGAITASSSFIKARKIAEITNDLNRYYKDSKTALVDYITSMNNAIETRKFFGSENAEVKQLRSTLLRKMNSLAKTKEKKPYEVKRNEIGKTQYKLSAINVQVETLSRKSVLTPEENLKLKDLKEKQVILNKYLYKTLLKENDTHTKQRLIKNKLDKIEEIKKEIKNSVDEKKLMIQ